MTEQLVQHIGKYCRAFRLIHMDKTIREVAAASDYNEKILSHFENGKANNIQHLACYVRACKDQQQLDAFYKGFTGTIMKYDRLHQNYQLLDILEGEQIKEAKAEWEAFGK